VFRQWEWRLHAPAWKETTDHWTCIRCLRELPTVPASLPRYRVDRPHMDHGLVAAVNRASAHMEAHGMTDVRVLGGDPATRVRCQSSTESPSQF